MRSLLNFRLLISTAIIVICSCLCPHTTSAQTEVEGEVSGRWDQDRSPFIVIDNILVPENEELNIDPGVVILFHPETGFSAEGQLTAIGTEEDSIRFSSFEEEPQRSDWEVFSASECEMDYCVFEYGRGVSFTGLLENSTIKHMEMFGLGLSRGSVARNCVIYDIDSDEEWGGVGARYMQGGVLERSIIADCDYGVYTYDGGTLNNSIVYNTAWNNINGWDFGMIMVNNIFYEAGEISGFVGLGRPWLNNNCSFDVEDPPFRQMNHVNINGVQCDENGNFIADPLFVNLEEFDFHLQERSPCIDAGLSMDDDEEPIRDPDGSLIDVGKYYFDQGETVEQVITLNNGWNLISSFIDVPLRYYHDNEDNGPDIRRIFRPHLAQIIMVKDEQGRFYFPEQDDFNNIPFYAFTEGYLVKCDGDFEMSWWGQVIDAQTNIPLEEGWNFMTYLPQYELPTDPPDMYAFEPMLDQLIIAKDERGRFCAPEFDFSNMGNLRPGEGYQVKMAEDVVFNYPLEPEEVNKQEPLTAPEPKHFTGVTTTGSNMSLLIMPIELDCGICEIGVFNSKGEMIGSSAGNPRQPIGVAVWGDDPVTDYIDGRESGEALTIKVWDGLNEYEAILDCSIYYIKDDLVATYLSLDNPVPEEFCLYVYPNPFNSHIKLTYALPQASRLRISIFDMTGRLYQSLQLNEQSAGWHSHIINAQNWTSGIYYARIVTGEVDVVKKVVCVK